VRVHGAVAALLREPVAREQFERLTYGVVGTKPATTRPRSMDRVVRRRWAHEKKSPSSKT
jgi:hypothetical protein